jgi:FMN phosphatase YigB (HAD superfamily)
MSRVTLPPVSALDAVLLDLDDTLLGNDMDVFLPVYLAELSAHAAPLVAQQSFLPALLAGTKAMISSTDPGRSNYEIFWSVFERATNSARAHVEPHLLRYYENDFDRLQRLTSCLPSAASLIRQLVGRGLRVVIATNPVFPRAAIQARLRWAGLDAQLDALTLVTTYEDMHFCKPNLGYYREILERIQALPGRSLMIGNDPENDIEPALQAGLYAHCVVSASKAGPAEGDRALALLSQWAGTN